MSSIEVVAGLSPAEFQKPEWTPVLEAYMAEAQWAGWVKELAPQWPVYQDLFDRGILGMFGAYSDGKPVGVMNLLHNAVPHRKDPFLAVETIYALPAYPRAGARLLRMALAFATHVGMPLILTAPTGGRLDNALASSRLLTRTHTVYSFDPGQDPKGARAVLPPPAS